jgi:hypothetical protein
LQAYGRTTRTAGVNAAGDSVIHIRQSFRVLPAWNGNPYRTRIIARIHDASLATEEERIRDVLVCGYASTCWGTTQTYPDPWIPPFVVNIVGNSQIAFGIACQWSAIPDAGVPPYSYQWTVNNQPHHENSQTITYGNNGTDFTLRVTVTDANGQSANASHSVAIAPGYYCQ